MLADSYTMGTSGAALTYTKQYDAIDKATFSVAGLALNAARTLSVSHQTNNKRGRRSLLDFGEVDVNPASASGATESSRLYLVLDRSSFKSAADCEAMRVRLKTFVDDATLFGKWANGEV